MRWTNAFGTEIPLTEIEHDEYQDIPNKFIEGIPTEYYVRRDRSSTAVFIWPTPRGPINGEAIRLTYNRRTQIIQLANVATEEVDVPQEWLLTVTYCLAALLSDAYGAHGENVSRVIARGDMYFEKLMAYEREGDLALYPDERYLL